MNALVDPSRCNHGHKLANVRRMVELWVLLLARPLFLILHLGSCRFSTGAVVRDDDRVMLIAASSPMWRDAAMAEARPRPAPWSACNRCIGWDRSWMDGWMDATGSSSRSSTLVASTPSIPYQTRGSRWPAVASTSEQTTQSNDKKPSRETKQGSRTA